MHKSVKILKVHPGHIEKIIKESSDDINEGYSVSIESMKLRKQIMTLEKMDCLYFRNQEK